MSIEIQSIGCHLGFKKLQIPCQTTNYLKSQNNYMYALPISRFQLSDILVFIADITRRHNDRAHGPSVSEVPCSPWLDACLS